MLEQKTKASAAVVFQLIVLLVLSNACFTVCFSNWPNDLIKFCPVVVVVAFALYATVYRQILLCCS